MIKVVSRVFVFGMIFMGVSLYTLISCFKATA